MEAPIEEVNKIIDFIGLARNEKMERFIRGNVKRKSSVLKLQDLLDKERALKIGGRYLLV